MLFDTRNKNYVRTFVSFIILICSIVLLYVTGIDIVPKETDSVEQEFPKLIGQKPSKLMIEDISTEHETNIITKSAKKIHANLVISPPRENDEFTESELLDKTRDNIENATQNSLPE
jgi:hypothetical protein